MNSYQKAAAKAKALDQMRNQLMYEIKTNQKVYVLNWEDLKKLYVETGILTEHELDMIYGRGALDTKESIRHETYEEEKEAIEKFSTK